MEDNGTPTDTPALIIFTRSVSEESENLRSPGNSWKASFLLKGEVFFVFFFKPGPYFWHKIRSSTHR